MIKYIVLEEKRQVIAIMDGDTSYDAINKIFKMCKNSPIFVCDINKYKMPSSFKATATCHPDDTFDVEYGKQIAKGKLLRNYYNSFDKRIFRFCQDLYGLNENVFGTENNPLTIDV